MKTTQIKSRIVAYNHTTNIFDNIRNRISCATNGATVFLPHVCNNINLFGVGFANAIGDAYPTVKQNFHMLGNKAKLGYVQYVTVTQNKNTEHRLIVANMIAQNKVVNEKNPRPLNYEYLMKCMIDVRSQIANIQKTYDEKIEIHCPKFGSGLAGGNWDFINELINDVWKDIPVFVYSAPNKIYG